MVGMKNFKRISLFIIIIIHFTKEVPSAPLHCRDAMIILSVKLTGSTKRYNVCGDMVDLTNQIINSLPRDVLLVICKIGQPCKEPVPLGNFTERSKLLPENFAYATGTGSGFDCLSVASTTIDSKGSMLVIVNDQPWEKELIQQTISSDKVKEICDLNSTMLHVVVDKASSTSEVEITIEILKCSNGKIVVSDTLPFDANYTKLNVNDLQSNYFFNPLEPAMRKLGLNFTESCIAGNNNRDSSSMDAPSEDNSSEDVSSKDAASEDGSSKGGSAKNASSKSGYLCLLSISMIPLQSLLWGP